MTAHDEEILKVVRRTISDHDEEILKVVRRTMWQFMAVQITIIGIVFAGIQLQVTANSNRSHENDKKIESLQTDLGMTAGQVSAYYPNDLVFKSVYQKYVKTRGYEK